MSMRELGELCCRLKVLLLELLLLCNEGEGIFCEVVLSNGCEIFGRVEFETELGVCCGDNGKSSRKGVV